jgi:hypothetical protein
MRWTELSLSGPSFLIFADGSSATIRWHRKLRRGEPEDSAEVLFPGGRSFELTEAVDAGETVDTTRIFAISGKSAGLVLLLGGPIAYRVYNSGHAEEAFRLYRESAYAEYWETQLTETDLGLLVVYEGGVLLLDEDLRVVWHRKKYFNDFFGGIQGEKLSLLRDHQKKLILSLKDGSPV